MGQQIGSFFKSKYTGQQIENMLDSATNIADQYNPAASYVVGDLVLYNNGLYVCTGATTGTFDPAKWQQTTLDEILTNLGATYTDPNNDGNVVIGVDSTVGEKILRSLTFPGLTNRYYLPFAQYIRERLQNDPSAASFSIEIPDAEEAPMHSTVIKGKTVAVNQLVQEPVSTGTYIGLTVTNNGDGSVTITGTPSYSATSIVPSNRFTKTVTGHILYVFGGDSVVRLRGYSSRNYADSDSGNGIIITAASENEPRLAIMCPNTTTEVNAKIYPQCADLSLYFTAAELTTIGADVATMKTMFLKKYGYPFPKYIAPNVGSLVNVNGVYRMRGRNLWDEEWEAGDLNGTTGQPQTSSTYIRSKNFCKCKANESIYVRATDNAYVFWYDANQNFISHTSTVQNSVVTSPSNAVYFKLTNKSTAYNYNITLNESDASINGQHFPYYNGGEIDLSSAPLNGVGSAYDEEDFATGERTTRMQIDDMGDLTWYKNNSWGFYATPSHVAKNFTNGQIGNGVCSAYPTGEGKGAPDAGTFVVYGDYIRIGDTSYADGDAFKTAMTGQKVCYEMLTPVVSNETPQPVYTQYGFNVFEPVSGGVQSAEVDATYYENIAGYIDKKLAEG